MCISVTSHGSTVGIQTETRLNVLRAREEQQNPERMPAEMDFAGSEWVEDACDACNGTQWKPSDSCCAVLCCAVLTWLPLCHQ